MTQDTKKILKFIREIDKVKFVKRQIFLTDNSKEDDAQHSFHTVMMVWVFVSSFEKKVNLERVFKMTLIHDLCEIYSGDIGFYDAKARVGKHERELKASKKLFSLLPKKLHQEMMNLWLEYEENKTPEARFAQAMDKLQPLIQNLISHGADWHTNHITEKMIREKKTSHTSDSKFLTGLLESFIKEANKNKYFPKN